MTSYRFSSSVLQQTYFNLEAVIIYLKHSVMCVYFTSMLYPVTGQYNRSYERQYATITELGIMSAESTLSLPSQIISAENLDTNRITKTTSFNAQVTTDDPEKFSYY